MFAGFAHSSDSVQPLAPISKAAEQFLEQQFAASTGSTEIKIGKIDIKRNNASLEAESRFTPQILDAFQHATINGKTVSIEVARSKRDTPSHKQGGARLRKRRKYKAA